MHTLAGAFALDALDEHERARFRRHLEECAECTQEVREMRATATRLGAAVAADPPPELKQRVLAQVRTTRQEPPNARRDAVGRSRPRRGVPRWALGITAAAAAVAIALAGVFAGLASNADDELNAVQQQLEQARDRNSPVGELLTAPDVRIASGGAITGGGGGAVVVSQAQDRMMFLGAELPESAPDRDYQLWLMDRAGVPHSAGIVGKRAGGGSDILMAGGVRDMAVVALTVEPRGGSPKPTTAPILWMDMPA